MNVVEKEVWTYININICIFCIQVQIVFWSFLNQEFIRVIIVIPIINNNIGNFSSCRSMLDSFFCDNFIFFF